MSNRQAGFTLIELMVVLVILMVISSIVSVSFYHTYERQMSQQFIDEWMHDLLFAQQMAMATGKPVQCIVQLEAKQYVIYQNGKPVLKERKIPSFMKIYPGTMGLTIVFKSTGGLTKSGTINVDTGKVRYHVVFLLGKGRFYAKEV